MNSITVLELYRTGTVWAFDDPNHGLEREALIAGSEEIIDTFVPAEVNTCGVMFSADAFPGANLHLERRESDMGGTWYETANGRRGWLCPSLFLYFDEAPETLHCRITYQEIT